MKPITIFCAALLLLGCAEPPASDDTTMEQPAALKLYVFDCGLIGSLDVSMFGLSADETPVRELFVPCYLIEHPQGRLIWDAGLPLEMAGQGRIEEESGAYMTYETSLATQLDGLGIAPGDVDLVAFSHLHYDHVGAANLFTSAEWLIQDSEHAVAFNEEGIAFFQPALYAELADNEKRILTGDHDVFGDGTVQIISAPGHTPGHQVLLLRLANTGPLVLSGDLYHFAASRELTRVPVFNTDAEQTLESMKKVETLIAAEGATLWIEHEKALAETLNLAPAYYD